MAGSFRGLHHTPRLPASQDPTLALAHGHAPRVEVLQERNGILPRDAQQVLDVAGADLLLLAQVGHDLVLDGVERRGVEEERLLDAYEALGLHEVLEQLVILAAAHAGAAERLLGARRGRRRVEKLTLDLVDDPPLLLRQTHYMRREADLVTIHSHHSLSAEHPQQVREHSLVRGAGPAAQLLA